MKLPVRSAVAAILFASAAPADAAQQPPAPCSGPEYRRLDFWVGTWDLSWTRQDGKPGKGRNVITRTFDGCVIEERFTDLDGPVPFSGASFSMYHALAKSWRQTWVDNAGGYIPLKGGPSAEGFQFRIDDPAQKRVMRMIWKNVTADSLDWHWQQSQDDGKTWEDRWVIHYERAK